MRRTCVFKEHLVVAEWRKLLELHPDEEYREHLLKGMEQGFRLVFR